MYKKPDQIPIDRVMEELFVHSGFFESMNLPVVYATCEDLCEPLDILSDRVQVLMTDEMMKLSNTDSECFGDGADGECVCCAEGVYKTSGRVNGYQVENTIMCYPKFRLTFYNYDGHVYESTILHEMIHLYQYTLEFNHFVVDDGMGTRNIGFEKHLHKYCIAPARTKALKRLNYKCKKIYGDWQNYVFNCCYDHAIKSTKLRSHDLLFFRISLILDNKMGYRPGTIFGYGLDGLIDGVMKELDNVKKDVKVL